VRLAGRVALAAFLALAVVATGVVGYLVGTQDRPGVWTDREATLTGPAPWISSLRCTYHLADGSKRVIEGAVLATTANAVDFAVNRQCPPPP
jgi:hypothetical protein